MNLFNKTDFGKTIDSKISDYIKANTTRKDIAIASEKSGVGTSTIRDVAYGYNSLTESNSKGIEQLLIIANKNFVANGMAKKMKSMLKVNELLQNNLVA